MWTLEEANAALPRIEPLLADARAALAPVREVREAIRALLRDAGDVRDPDNARHYEWQALMAQHKERHAVLDAALRAFAEAGVVVKDLDRGLIDFYATIGDQVVLLCWLEGEPRVGHWHDLESGFGGRQPVPDAIVAAP